VPGRGLRNGAGGVSGPATIAAEQTGCHAFLMELDTLYCDVIVQRHEKFTGNKTKRIADTSASNTPAEAASV